MKSWIEIYIDLQDMDVFLVLVLNFDTDPT